MEEASFDELDAVLRAASMTPAEFAKRATAAAVRLHPARDAAERDVIGYQAMPVADEKFAMDPADLLRASDETWFSPLVHVRIAGQASTRGAADTRRNGPTLE